MELLGNTRIYGVKIDDIANEKTYTLAATVRDLYDTLKEEGDNVAIWLESAGGYTKADALVKVKSITKSDVHPQFIYRFRDLMTGINEELTGNDAAIYCTGDTSVKVPEGIVPVELLKLSRNYEVDKLELADMDLYSIELDSFANGSNIIRTNIVINGITVMLNNTRLQVSKKERLETPNDLNDEAPKE